MIAVTGAYGFVGRALCQAIRAQGLPLRALSRGPQADGAAVVVGDLAQLPDLAPALAGVDVLIHLAARVHVMRETAADPLAEFRRANVEATRHLAYAAAAAGVRRLVYASSAKVNGEDSGATPFRADDPPHPQDAYAVSKWEAEQALWRVAAETGLEVVVLRPPLVYGPGVGGNFLRLLRWVQWGAPLPLAALRNRRSLLFVGNLADALLACALKPAAAGQTYLVCDGEACSTPELMRRLAQSMHRPCRLWPCPPAVLRLGTALLGKSAEWQRLAGSLELDDSDLLRRELAWQPPYSAQQGLEITAQWFKQRGNECKQQRP